METDEDEGIENEQATDDQTALETQASSTNDQMQTQPSAAGRQASAASKQPSKGSKKDEEPNCEVVYNPPKGKEKPRKLGPCEAMATAPLKEYKKPKPTRVEVYKAKVRSRRSDDPTNPLIRHAYNMHRYRIETSYAIVDSSCPIVVKNLYGSSTRFNRRLAEFGRIERENAKMTERIAKILQKGGGIDNKLIRPKWLNNRGEYRQMNLLQITFENLNLLRRIQEQRPTYDRLKQMADFKQNEKFMAALSNYPLYWKQKKLMGWEAYEESALENANVNPRPRVFLDLSTDKENLGRFVIELRADVVPMTAENFRALCTGQYGLCYKCSKIHRIIPDILWQGGDITGMDGYGNKSIYGDKFPNENFILKHDDVGTVSMANIGSDTNGSQFIITARPMPALDGKNVVIGKVVAGMEVLNNASNLVTSTGRIKKKIWVIDCGEIPAGQTTDDFMGTSNADEDKFGEEEDTNLPPQEAEVEENEEAEAQQPESTMFDEDV